MTFISIINAMVVIIGVPAMVGTLVYIGRRLNVLDTIESDLRENVRPDLKNVRERFLVVEDHVDTLWKDKIAPSHSPRQLNDAGKEILTKSGIKEIVDMKKLLLLEAIKKSILDKNIDNAYDAEKEIEIMMNNLPEKFPDIVKNLKNGAFKVGQDINVVLFVGSIHLRNMIFGDLGFNLDDLDLPKGK